MASRARARVRAAERSRKVGQGHGGCNGDEEARRQQAGGSRGEGLTTPRKQVVKGEDHARQYTLEFQWTMRRGFPALCENSGRRGFSLKKIWWGEGDVEAGR